MVFNIQKPIIVIHQVRRVKKKKPNRMIILNEAEKGFDRIQLVFLLSSLSKLGIGENFLNLIKGIDIKPTADILTG